MSKKASTPLPIQDGSGAQLGTQVMWNGSIPMKWGQMKSGDVRFVIRTLLRSFRREDLADVERGRETL